MVTGDIRNKKNVFFEIRIKKHTHHSKRIWAEQHGTYHSSTEQLTHEVDIRQLVHLEQADHECYELDAQLVE
jgi:hypothetical protein